PGRPRCTPYRNRSNGARQEQDASIRTSARVSDAKRTQVSPDLARKLFDGVFGYRHDVRPRVRQNARCRVDGGSDGVSQRTAAAVVRSRRDRSDERQSVERTSTTRTTQDDNVAP